MTRDRALPNGQDGSTRHADHTSGLEMFDSDRVKETHSPGGWKLPGTSTRAINGHVFGLHLEPSEREQLIAFLRTL
jgi:hypothetical protein